MPGHGVRKLENYFTDLDIMESGLFILVDKIENLLGLEKLRTTG